VIECREKFVHRLRTKCVAHLWPVERDAHRARIDAAVVGDVAEREARHGSPRRRVEQGRDRRAASRRSHPFSVAANCEDSFAELGRVASLLRSMSQVCRDLRSAT